MFQIICHLSLYMCAHFPINSKVYHLLLLLSHGRCCLNPLRRRLLFWSSTRPMMATTFIPSYFPCLCLLLGWTHCVVYPLNWMQYVWLENFIFVSCPLNDLNRVNTVSIIYCTRYRPCSRLLQQPSPSPALKKILWQTFAPIHWRVIKKIYTLFMAFERCKYAVSLMWK